MNNDLRYSCGIKGLLYGAMLAFVVLAPVEFIFGKYFTTRDFVSGLIAGAFLGLILKSCIPVGFPIPKVLTTFTALGFSVFSFWVIIAGIMNEEIHGLPRRRGGVTKGFSEMWSWKNDPGIFLFLAIAWSVVGAVCVGMPIYYNRKAIRETSPVDVSTGARTFQSVFNNWKTLPENTRAISVFIIVVSTILVFFYLLILLKD